MAGFTTLAIVGLAAAGTAAAARAKKKKADAGAVVTGAPAITPPIPPVAPIAPPTPPDALKAGADAQGQAAIAAARQRKRSKSPGTLLGGGPVGARSGPATATTPRTLLGY